MNSLPERDRLTLTILCFGVAVPVIYYGVQIASASFDPRYSFVHQAASELGSDRAVRPEIFNKGIMAQGAVTLVASVGFLRAMLRVGIHSVLACLASAAVAVNGVQTLWAGYFPMPDPRHGGHPAFIIAMILLPVLFAAALWRGGGAALKVYFVATLALLLVMVPIMSGMTAMDTVTLRGLLQRVYTLTVFPPMAVAAIALTARLRRAADPAHSRA